MKAAAETQPSVFMQDFVRDVKHVLSRVERSNRAFSDMRGKINTEAATNKLNAPMAAYFKVTTGKLASKAVVALHAMNEKSSGDTFNAVSAQTTYQGLIKKPNLNALYAKHESSLQAICFFAYGPKDGRTIWSQLCAQVDLAKVARIRAETKAAQGPTQMRKAG